MKGFPEAPDWRSVEPEIFDKIKEEDFHDYLRICLDKGMKDTVLKSILKPPKNRFGNSTEDDYDEFADKLANDFQEKIIEYYWQMIFRKKSSNITGKKIIETYRTGTEIHTVLQPNILERSKISISMY